MYFGKYFFNKCKPNFVVVEGKEGPLFRCAVVDSTLEFS